MTIQDQRATQKLLNSALDVLKKVTESARARSYYVRTQLAGTVALPLPCWLFNFGDAILAVTVYLRVF